jgi:hypothetical protein
LKRSSHHHFLKAKTMKLSETQTKLLTAAAQHPEHLLVDFPANLKGGALIKVITSLGNAGLIAPRSKASDGSTRFAITAAGLQAIGIEPAAKPKRQGSTQAMLIEMMKRPEGATLAQICAATGWQVHTARGFMSGSLKKKLGMNVVSDKQDDQARKYHIA